MFGVYQIRRFFECWCIGPRLSALLKGVAAISVLTGGGLAAEEAADDADRQLTAPLAEAPTIDGTIAAGEWDDATRIRLTTGGLAWFKHDGESLYIGLRGVTQATGNVCVQYDGSIHMLRSGDGIGTVVYRPAGSGWSTDVTKFDNVLRQKATNKAIQAKRDEYFENHGWLASNRRTGNLRDMEYRISLGLTGLDAPKIAIAYALLKTTSTTIQSWPHDLDDGCNSTVILAGRTEKGVFIDPTSWGTVVLE